MDIGIISIGTAVPPFRRAQLETAELIIAGLNLKNSERRLLRTIYKATGIDFRHSVLSDYCKSKGNFDFFPNDPESDYPKTSKRMEVYKKNALPLALKAIDDCIKPLSDSIINEITHVITVSCTGMYAPGLDIEIVQHLKLRRDTKRTTINFMGCYGAFNGIKVADAVCRADHTAKVLVVCVEICTIHFQKKITIDNLISNSIFSDGAAAVIITAEPLQKKYLNLKTFYCDIVPQSSNQMAWQIADYGFDIVLSTYVPEVIEAGILAFTKNLFQQSGITEMDIDYYAIHPGGIKILQSCEQALKITLEQNCYSYQVLREFGNMSSATILFVLKAIWNDLSNSSQKKNIFSCAFGPGLTLESMILEVV